MVHHGVNGVQRASNTLATELAKLNKLSSAYKETGSS